MVIRMINFQKQKGNAGFLVVLIILLLATVVVAYSKLSDTQVTTLKTYEDSFKARYNSEAGVESFISNFNLDIETDETFYDTYSNTYCDKYIDTFFEDESKTKPIREIKDNLNNGTYSVCFVEKYKEIEEVDYNDDGIIDDTIIRRRVFELISVGEYKKMESAVYAEIDFYNDNGYVITTVNKWLNTK